MISIWRSVGSYRPSVSFILLLVLIGTLWVAGGASRPDVMGQVVTRSVAWLVLIVAFLCGAGRMAAREGPIQLLLFATVLLVILQLIPLPPAIWERLPGRSPFIDGTSANAIWRPWSIVPWTTVNAASSLIVPVSTLILVSGLNDIEEKWLPNIILGVIFISTLVGLMQFSGVVKGNMLINDGIGSISGNFANRNHFALFLAMGCLITPVWALSGKGRRYWKFPAALALVTLFALTILATGSRAGILTGPLALIAGLLLSQYSIGQGLRRMPRWVSPALIAAIISMVAIMILISFSVDRALSINRAIEIDSGQDMRSQGLPTVLAMISIYFPAGTGFGSFDPMFRMHEQFELLKQTYFNHAHNDFLEIVLGGGLPALLLLLAALGWYVSASVRIWRTSAERHILPKLGSAMLLLILVASVFDYPARTPMIMAMIVIAGTWLSQGATTSRSALPGGH